MTHHKGSESPFSSIKIKLTTEQSAQKIRLFRKCKSVEEYCKTGHRTFSWLLTRLAISIVIIISFCEMYLILSRFDV